MLVATCVTVVEVVGVVVGVIGFVLLGSDMFLAHGGAAWKNNGRLKNALAFATFYCVEEIFHDFVV